ncbi:MAG: InlB B-repeat-containing protein [Fibrobacter sp.]|nr:InlB B-repeat-containing protein [Fibrobacter sp.]
MGKMVRAVLFAVMAVFSTAVFAETGNPCAMPENLDEIDGVYQIGTCGDLYKFAEMVNGGKTSINGMLTADISVNVGVLTSDGTLSGTNFTQWTPIGTETQKFKGTFDGNGHTISGLYFSDENVYYVGLFGYIGNGANVQNVGVADSYIKGQIYVGGVVGYCSGAVSNAYNMGAVDGDQYVGGVVGGNKKDGNIENVYNTGTVSGGYAAGGVVGDNSGLVRLVYNTGAVKGKPSNRDIGGVVGYNEGFVSNAYYNTDFYTGGAVGTNGGKADVEGKTTAELASITLPSDWWYVGSGEPFGRNGKLVYKLPKLKIFESQSQPELVVFQEKADGYYEISNAQELKWFAQLVNSGTSEIIGELTADICLNACGEGESVLKADGTLNGDGSNFTQWTPIGTSSTPYKGFFDGNGHTISGLYFNDESKDNVGLFGYIGNDAFVQNVGMEDSYIRGAGTVGVVAGYNDGTVSIVYNTGAVSGGNKVGGVVGVNGTAGTVEMAYNTGAVSGGNMVGGVVGSNDGTVRSVYNTGAVSGEDGVGGVVGSNGGTVIIAYNTGAVSGTAEKSEDVGGVVGNNGGTVRNVYNTGAVSGIDRVGGVVGYNKNIVSDAYYNTDFYTGSAVGENGGIVRSAEGKPTAELASTTLPPNLWVAGSGEQPVVSDGKLVYKLPGLIDVGSQPEIEYTGFQPNADGYYEISNALELKCFAQLVNSGATSIKGRLTADICVNACGEGESVLKADGTLNGNGSNFTQWTPIGTFESPYKGTFDGNGHTINGLYFNDENADGVGLFGSIDYGAKVQNVGVVDSYIRGAGTVGGVVGWNMRGSVSNVYNAGAVSGNDRVGGVVGNNGGSVSNVYNTGAVSGLGDVGGVVGTNEDGFVSNVYNTGAVNGRNDVGGVAGENGGFVSNVYNTGAVSGDGNGVGGVVGNNGGSVSNVYNTGAVSGENWVGGVVGYSGRTVSNVYYNTDSYTGSAVGKCDGECEYKNVEGKTTVELASTTLPDGFSSEIWVAGSGESFVNNGKLLLKLPGLKNVGSQPEIEYTGFQPNGDGFYEISTAQELKWFAQLVNGGATDINGKLTADICVNACGEGESVLKADGTLNGDGSNFTQWTPIGTAEIPYTGTFDGMDAEGNAHVIRGLYFNYGYVNYVGLFGHIGSGSTVKNVGVVDSYISGKDYVGGVVGYNEGTASNVYNTGFVSGDLEVGGVVGYNEGGSVSKVYNAGSVSGHSDVGGVVGDNDGLIDNGYNTGVVNGSFVGGVVGWNSGTVSNVYNTGSVSGSSPVGGIVGNNEGSVSNVYNTGFVSGEDDVGGIVGYNDADVGKAYYSTDVPCEGCSNYYGAGKTTAELASLTIGDVSADFPLLVGEVESPWIVGSGEQPVVSDGKLVYKLPGLIDVGSQPELVVFQENAEGYYEISNAQELKWFAQLVNSGATNINGRLTADICLNACGEGESVLKADGSLNGDGSNFTQWTHIGTDVNPYDGTFDGQGHTIRGLYFNDENVNYVGLFGFISDKAKVQNVGVVDSYFRGASTVGGVVGLNAGGTISNVYNNGTVRGNDDRVGGVVGNNGGAISNVYNTGAVSGEYWVGGVVGYNSGTVSNVYNTGAVSGNKNVGGVVGLNEGGTVSNVYNTGAVSGTNSRVGGVVGYVYYHSTVENAYYNTDSYTGSALGENVSGSIENVDGKTTVELASTTLPDGFSSEIWNAGSGEPVGSNGKLVYKLPGLKDVGTQPEIEYTGFQPNADGYYEISNALELKWFAKLVNGGAIDIKGKLTANICLNACGEDESVLKADGTLNGDGSNFTQWIPIGTKDAMFKGTFDGAGHTISGLYFNDDKTSYAGLFGRSTINGSIKNVGVVDSYIKGNEHVGGIVGHNGNCTVSNVFSTSTVEGATYVGGIAGFNEAGTIVNAYNMGAIKGKSWVGGIAGYNQGTTSHINNVYSSGTVSGTSYVRGLVGYNNESKTKIDNAFYNTDVFSGMAVGNVDGTNVEGKTTAELASTTLPEGFSSEIWLAGSKDVVDGKLVYKFPGLKIFNSQPELLLFNVQKGSDGKDYCEIANADDLFKFAQLVNGGATGLNAKLTADICVNGCGEGEKSLLEQVADLEAKDELSSESFRPWTPMNVSSNVTVAFDGNGHTISGLYFNKEKSSQIGLFGQVVGDVSVSNLGVVDFYVNGNGEVGSLAGQVTGKLNIKNCYSAGSVKGVHYIGGIVGVNRDGAELKIENSYNESSVNAPSGIVGGLVGEIFNFARLTITNSYNAGSVSGTQYVGGLVGDNYSAILTIENSYNAGTVSGTQYAGGLVGVNEDGTLNVSSSFFLATGGDGDALGGEVRSSDEFHDGTVAAELHNWCEKEDGSEDCKEGGLNGSVWGQVAAPREDGSVDTWPVLVLDGSGKLVFSIVAEMNGGSTKDAFATKYEYGTNYVLPIPERANYTFGGWFTDATFTEGSGITEIVSTDFGPKNVYAKWIPVKYTVKVAVNNSAMGVVEGLENSGVYDYGSEVTLRAVAKTGYEFSDWADDVKASAERTIVVTGNITYTANFKEIPASSSSSDAKSSSSEAASSSSEAKSSSSDGKSSSSSAKSSSSSAKSSSSEAKSSSSEAKSSSSDAKSSSSGAKSSSSSAKSSSSDAKSSSSQKESIIAQAQLPQFSVTASGKMVSIAGARPNSIVNVFDMQGNMVKTVVATSANFTFALPSAGVYIVKNGYTAKRVNVR